MAAALTSTQLDETLLRITALSVTALSVADVAMAVVAIATFISGRKSLGTGATVFLVLLSTGDLLLAPGGLAIMRILKGWEVLEKPMMQMTMALRDMPLIVVSVLHTLLIALLATQTFFQSIGKWSSGKLSVGLGVVAWLYAMLLLGAVVLYYGMALDGLMGMLAILRLPLAWLPPLFLRAWHVLNVVLWLLVAAVFTLLILKGANSSVQPLNDSTAAAGVPGTCSTKILAIQLILAVLTWLPYALYNCLISIDLMAFAFKWIHVYHFFYVFALFSSFLRPLLTIVMSPELKKTLKEVARCK
jgi:hypothetical protein